jgi:cytoskeletal protein CcmA (bactofilin family)
MWKRDETTNPAMPQQPDYAPGPERATAARTGERATIGRSITIRGEVTGDEDILIQGRVEGSVNLGQHNVTVGPEGEVKADIAGRIVTLEGSVEGDVRAQEQVVLRSSARVQGDITAPRVVLEDGARFRGGVDMGEPANRPERAGAKARESGSQASGNAIAAAGAKPADAAPAMPTQG